MRFTFIATTSRQTGADITSGLKNAFDAAKQEVQNTHDSNVVSGLKNDNVVAASPGLQ